MNYNHVIVALVAIIWLSLAFNNLAVFGISTVGLLFILVKRTSKKFDLKKLVERFYKFSLLQKLNIPNTKKPSARIIPLSINLPIFISKPILDIPIFQKLQKKLGSQIESEIRMSGKPANSLNMIKKSMSFSVLFVIIILPIAIALGIFVTPLFFALIILPMGIMFYPRMALGLAKSKRETAINHELAYFTKYASIMQSVEKTLYDSLVEIIGNGLFEIIETDAKMAYRNVTMFAMDIFEALNDIALHHPNRAFQSFLLSYVATAQTGGDLTNLIEREAESFFESLKENLKRYLGTATTFGEILLIILLIMPTFLIATSFLLPGGSVTLLLLVGVIGIPMMSMGLIVMIDSAQPRNLNKITIGNLAFVVAIIIAIAMSSLRQAPWLVITSSVLGFALANMFNTTPQFLRIKNIENALPEFLRDVTEYRKIGYDMTISLYRLYGTRKYNKYFNELFGMIYSQLKSGATLSGISGIEDKSWITKLVLFILGKLADTGGGTPLTLEHLTRFVSDVTTTKKSTMSALRMQMLLVYIGPIIMVFVSKTSISLLTKMSSNLSFFSNLGVGGAFAITPEFVDAINIVIVISSLAMGFVFTKISMFTLKDTKNVAITAIIVIIAILISPYLPSIF